jgi:hypothetical protein
MEPDGRSPYAMIAKALEQCLVAIAKERGCTPDELSFQLFRALEAFGLESFRLGEEYAAGGNGYRSGVVPVADVKFVATKRPR